MLNIIFCIALSSSIINTAPDYEDPVEWAIISGELAASLFITSAVHETGHVVFGEVVGIDIVQFSPYPTKSSDGTWVAGYNRLDGMTYASQSKSEKLLYWSGGMIATRSFGEGLDTLMNYTNAPTRVKQALAALYFLTRFEMTKSVLRAAVPCWLGIRESFKHDSQAMVELLSPDEKAGRPTTKQKMIYAGAALFLVLDILFDLDEIESNFDRLWLIDSSKEKNNFDTVINVVDNGIYGSIVYKF